MASDGYTDSKLWSASCVCVFWWPRGGRAGGHYPFLPISPMTALDFCMEYPSLSPKQDYSPYHDQKVRETRKATQGQVPAELVRHLKQESQRSPLPPRVPETMQRLHLAPEEAPEVAYGILVLEVRVVLAKAGRSVWSVPGRR